MTLRTDVSALQPTVKTTDVGTLPSDWVAVELGEIGQAYIGLTYSPTNVKDHGKLVLRSSNIQGGKLAFDDSVYVQMDVPERAITQKYDILICARNGSRQLIGKCALIDGEASGSAFGAFMSVYRSPSNRFIFQQFQSPAVKRQINDMMGATINQITSKDLHKIKVALPSTQEEQEAIAQALSDADGLIEQIEQLIAKKRAIKQGAMQELLTGKKRLSGFSGKWGTATLESLARISSGGTPSTSRKEFWDGTIPWCTPTDITALGDKKYLTNTQRTISNDGLKSSSAELLPVKSIVMTSRATIGECAINLVPMTTNQGFKNFVPYDHTDAYFLYYLLSTKKSELIGLCGGSTFLEISKTQVSGLEVLVPTDKKEQTEIGSILSKMDDEISALEEKLAKARAIKSGMMHELLTGKTRLV